MANVMDMHSLLVGAEEENQNRTLWESVHHKKIEDIKKIVADSSGIDM